jgi:hypothetical protein
VGPPREDFVFLKHKQSFRPIRPAWTSRREGAKESLCF